jgi:hypothetical protein
MTSITIHAPATVAAPLGSQIAADAFGRVLAWFSSVADAQVAQRQDVDRVTEANRVRRFANEMLGQDPRFAADLYAAADRHERS